jgi:hypothetical protein
MNARENVLRAIRFKNPETIPVSVFFNASCWNHYDQEELFRLKERHPRLFPGFQRPDQPITPRGKPWQHMGQRYRDPWGCVWETTEEGITGTVVEHPLADWDAFDNYLPPDPATTKGRLPANPAFWDEQEARIRHQKEQGQLASGALPHGHNFLRLQYLRGYENLVFDMADDEPRLYELIGMVESFYLYIARRYASLGVDMISYAEDLGMQQGPMLSPELFRRFVKPTFARVMRPAQQAGCVIRMHSDGDIRDLAEDLLDLGVQVLNVQDLVNGIDWLRDHLKGRVCLDVDIDRQNVVRFGSPNEVRELVREETEKLGAPEGGLMFKADIYPGIPVANLAALFDAIELHCLK